MVIVKKEINFVQQLSKYKKVEFCGRWMNNIGYVSQIRENFNQIINFSYFENNAYRPQHPGYTTEKLMEPMTANSALYIGYPLIGKEFNTKSFVNFYDHQKF